ncbi:MAG TPA: hypothetical protein VF753_17440 [Terriglobales bacterium]
MTDAVDELLAHIEATRGLSPVLKRLQRFHNANRDVLDLIVLELYDVRAMGWPCASVKSLWEYARWVLTKTKVVGEPFDMNDVFQSYYARIIAILHPDLNGFFEMREPQKLARQGRGPDAEMGTKLESVNSRPEDYGRRLLWADSTPLEHGWRPSRPHVPPSRCAAVSA